MTHYIGTDIIEIARIEQVIDRWGERFLRRVYTEPERNLYDKRPQALAARFAGKEAVTKVLGTAKEGISWQDIEILAHPSGKPQLNLYGRAQSAASNMPLPPLSA
jgi:holo-[acyl-carrier protein] synthase